MKSFVISLVCLLCLITGAADDPGAVHEARMKQAKRQVDAASSTLAKKVLTLETDHPEFSRMQTEYQAAQERLREVSQTIHQRLAEDDAYETLKTELTRLNEQISDAAGADREKLQKQRYQNHVARQQRQEELVPELTQQSRMLQEESRSLQRRLVLLARSALADHPAVAPLLAEHEAARQAVAEAKSAMLEARGQVTPIQYLASRDRPVFKQGHTLPPLTRYGWAQPFELRKAFADGWGYAVELGGYITEKTLDRLDDPESDEARTIALVNSDPDTYKLSVTCARHFPDEPPPGTWARDADGNLLNAQAKSYDGTEWHPGMKTVISPLAPDALWQEMARGRAQPLAEVRQRAPISIILNGGEYGLGVLGFARKVWVQDPRIVEAVEAYESWFEFVSQRKAHSEMIIAEAVRQAVPDRQLYIHYTTAGGGHRNRWPGWVNWGYDYAQMHPISDLPSDEHYVNHFNSGFVGKMDILTLALNSVGVQIAHGKPLAYSWFWAKRRDEDMRRYLGFLKCIYLMGTIGGNAGAYHQPDFEAGFEPEDPPYWLEQQIALSRVHAFFSHLEDYLRNGDLLPGDYRHFWTHENPAYELLPEALQDQVQKRGGQEVLPLGRPVRVLARQHQTKPECLVVAWAASGDERQVAVDIPRYGKTQLLARPGGSVYLLREGAAPKLLDQDQDFPSCTISP